MKKLISLILTLALVLCLASCAAGEQAPGGSGEGQDASQPAGSGAPSAPSEPDAPSEPSDAPESSSPSFAPNTPSFPVPNVEGGDNGGDEAPPITPGFPSIAVPGQGSEAEDVPVTDAGDLVDKLDSLCEGIVSDSCFTQSLPSSGSFSNYFGGKVAYAEGMRVAVNVPAINIDKHIAMLIEVPEGEDAEEYADDLLANADPNWTICGGPAESVQCEARDGLVLFVMSSADIADSLIAAFNE